MTRLSEPLFEFGVHLWKIFFWQYEATISVHSMYVCKHYHICKQLLSGIWLLSSCTWTAKYSSMMQLWLLSAAVDYTWYQYMHLVAVMTAWKARLKGIHKMRLFSSSNINMLPTMSFLQDCWGTKYFELLMPARLSLEPKSNCREIDSVVALCCSQ